MGRAWTNDFQTFLIIPTGATSGARIAINEANSGAILVYNAAGQLFEAIASMAGTDPYGYSYPAGFSVGVPGNPQVVITVAADGKSGLIYWPTGSTHIHNSGGMQAFMQGTGTAAYDELQILWPQDNVIGDAVITAGLSSSNDGTTQQAQLQEYYSDPSAVLHLYRTVSYNGCIIAAGNITAVKPGTGLARNNVAVAETWHTAALQTGFATGGSDQAPRFRYEPIAGGQVRLDGTVYTNAATAANALMFTLDPGYRPTTRKRFTGVNSVSGNTLGATLVNVATTGAVTLGPAASATGQQIVLDGITFPVD